MRKRLKKLIAEEILRYFANKKICCKWELYKDDIVAVWVDDAKLFAYLCWRTTNLCVKNGLNMYKGIKNVDYEVFLELLSNNVNIDRTNIQKFEIGFLPKRHKMIDEGLNKVLRGLFVNYKE